MLRQLERRLQRFAIPNVTVGLIALQVAVFVMNKIEPGKLDSILLLPDLVLQKGQLWRLVTFLATPPTDNALFAFFFWYVFYLMGTALEQSWGSLRYNVYLLIGYLATVAAAFWQPHVPAENTFLEGSVFLAFAYLFPNFEFVLFFVLPVKVRYLAIIQWAFYVLAVSQGQWIVLASVVNYFVFFGRSIIAHMRSGQRRMATQVRRIVPEKQPFHRCVTCGITDLTNPEMEFRYCSKCHGTCGYCSRHLHDHEHVAAPQVPAV